MTTLYPLDLKPMEIRPQLLPNHRGGQSGRLSDGSEFNREMPFAGRQAVRKGIDRREGFQERSKFARSLAENVRILVNQCVCYRRLESDARVLEMNFFQMINFGGILSPLPFDLLGRRRPKWSFVKLQLH